MKLPILENFKVQGKKILLRLDLDVPVKGKKILDDTRIQVSIPTIKYLVGKGISGIVILGHRGRPGGKTVKGLSLEPVGRHLEKLLNAEFGKEKTKELDILMMENLRFDPAETAPNTSMGKMFAKELAGKGDFYVNDAFGVSHRDQVSITSLPKFLPHAAGLHLAEEVKKLEKVLEKPKRPVVFVLSGGKEDKSVLIPKLLNHADWLLVGGLVAKHTKSFCRDDGHICVVAAHLTHDGKDITPDSARNFAEVIRDAGTIVWNGPMGDIDSGYWEATKIVAEAVAKADAYKVVGGGDTIHALKKLKLLDKFDHVSTGGGAMLEFLAYGDLPGLRVLRIKN